MKLRGLVTLLCAVRTEHANNKVMSIRRHTAGGADVREVVLDWPTNKLACRGGGKIPCAGQLAPTATLSSCPQCLCNPDYTLPLLPRAAPVGVSPYAFEMCRRVAQAERCRFRRGVVVGLGTGYLSGCLAYHCPTLDLTTLDVDPDVLSAANSFFGWENRSSVVIGDTETWFRQAADRSDQLDLILVDCFSRHGIAAGCRRPGLLASFRRVLQPTHRDGPTLFAVNIFGPSLTYRHDFARALGHRATVEHYDGQWLTFFTGGARQLLRNTSRRV